MESLGMILYGMYVHEMDAQGIEVDAWDDLDGRDQRAWECMATVLGDDGWAP